MSTEHIRIKSNNPNFPDDVLIFETGVGGTKFIIEDGVTGEVMKFWFAKADWEKLKEMVDWHI